MNKEVEIKITSEIRRENDSAVFERGGLENLERIGNNWRLRCNEKNKEDDVEVKLLIKLSELVMQQGDTKGDHTLMKLESGEKQRCRAVTASKRMDLVSLTNKLDFSKASPGKT